jgi:hypothetical protein
MFFSFSFQLMFPPSSLGFPRMMTILSIKRAFTRSAFMLTSSGVLESVTNYPQERGARFDEGRGRFTAMPSMTLRLRYLTCKLRALCWVLWRLRVPRISPSSASR